MNRSKVSPLVPLVPEHYDALTDCVYDANNRLVSCSFRNGGVNGAVLASLTLTYDSNGNLLTAVRA